MAFDLPGLDTAAGICRTFEIARTDLLGMENSISRARALISVGVGAAGLLKTTELEARVVALEALRRDTPPDDGEDL